MRGGGALHGYIKRAKRVGAGQEYGVRVTEAKVQGLVDRPGKYRQRRSDAKKEKLRERVICEGEAISVRNRTERERDMSEVS
jgi:hypothetical protein